ncbi:MAG: SurA N-terminal domain-containing protein [Deltaproteobacteria bacterium]
MKKDLLIRTLVLIAVGLSLFSCSGKSREGKEIAKVNDAAILLSEFQKEVAIAAERNPAIAVTEGNLRNILDTMIERRLMIEEAQKKGLSEDKRFLDTIKTYWEQTLIRELIDAKTREWEKTLFVSDDEIKAQYERMRHRLRIKYVRVEQEDAVHEAQERLRSGNRHEQEEESQILVENIGGESPLSKAFDMAQGEVRAFEENGRFMVVRVVSKEEQKLEPLNEAYGRIKQTLLEGKRQKAVAEWLDETKAKAKIRVDENILKGIAKVRDEK